MKLLSSVIDFSHAIPLASYFLSCVSVVFGGLLFIFRKSIHFNNKRREKSAIDSDKEIPELKIIKERLRGEIEQETERINVLNDKTIDALQHALDTLQTQYEDLSSKYDKLLNSFEILQTKYDDLHADYCSLKDQINSK